MTDTSKPDFTEVIDVTTLPNWNDSQVQETFAKIDEFLNDPGTGVTRELPGKSPHCEDPACVDGMIPLNLNDPDDFQKAHDSVEGYVMGAMFAAHEAPGEDPAMLQELAEYLLTLPRQLLVEVLMSIADAAGGLFIAYNKLKSENGDADV